jgi:hypothetical protein
MLAFCYNPLFDLDVAVDAGSSTCPEPGKLLIEEKVISSNSMGPSTG